MNKQHHKIEIKRVTEEGFFSGYASVFNVKDLQNDSVEKGAFMRAISEGPPPKMLWQHDPCFPIGKWISVKEDERGLFVEGQIFLALEKGREAFLLLKEGVLDGLSIGYEIQNARPRKGGRVLSEVKLHEISLVTFPANTEARVLDVKAENHMLKRLICLRQKLEDLTTTRRENE